MQELKGTRPWIRANAVLSKFPPGPIRGAELGVQWGYMSAQFLHIRQDLELFMVDCWPKKKLLNAATEFTSFAADRRTIIHSTTDNAVDMFKDCSLDFAFIDADHSYQACLTDIWNWLPKVKIYGWLCGHDYNKCKGVNDAVFDFLIGNGWVQNFSIGEDYTWFFQRPNA